MTMEAALVITNIFLIIILSSLLMAVHNVVVELRNFHLSMQRDYTWRRERAMCNKHDEL